MVQGPSGLAEAHNVHATGADLHDEEAGQVLEVIAQSTWKQSTASIIDACVRRNYLPRGVCLPLWCREDPQGLEDSADRRGTDPVAEFEQFALDPLAHRPPRSQL